MYRIPGVLSAATTTSAPAVPRVPPTADLPPGSPRAAEDEIVVRRLLTAGEDLQAALGLMGDHPASAKIRHAVDEMDQAIRDIRGRK
jgi:hypothetical protein